MKIKEQTRKLAAGYTGVRQGEADVVWIWFSKSITRTLPVVSNWGMSLYEVSGGSRISSRGFEWALWSKRGGKDSNEELAKELADVIHYTVAIAGIKYQHERDLERCLNGNI